MIELLDAYKKCLYAKYVHVDEDGDYAIEKDGNTMYLLFECSNSKTDWHHNFMFGARPYKEMEVKWRCHRGFLRVWKSIEPHIAGAVEDKTVKKIYVIGYSHGAAIATLCHEYVWFHRPDLRENGLEGFGFGCPRCYFGWHIKKELKERWEHFHPIRNCGDLISHLPPVLFGYTHVNKTYSLKNKKLFKKYHCSLLNGISAHYQANYLYSLEKENENFHNKNKGEELK